MLIKVLGGIDFVLGLILMFGTGFGLSSTILTVFAIILIIKSSFGFWRDFGSWVDLVCGGIFILSIFISVHWVIGMIAGLLMIQKGIFSFL